MSVLDNDVLMKKLGELPDWVQTGNRIQKEYTFDNFKAALDFVNLVGKLAEQQDHHPDILLYSWNKVRLSLSTHSEGGITENDILLARKIDENRV
jgi:4a-hydroxytetrahydrobiopterin dehydratase